MAECSRLGPSSKVSPRRRRSRRLCSLAMATTTWLVAEVISGAGDPASNVVTAAVAAPTRVRSCARCVGDLDELCESSRIVDGHLGKHLAVNVDIRCLQSRDEP